MATLAEIEARIQEHEKRLIELQEEGNKKRIEVMISIISFWKKQKEKALKSKNKTA
ncbi:hypothetical protein [Flavobacterium sp. UMI-01]|uniref:hypothetical protein n=1 Tax=Flavobacterium sp. UMI-01 TaxID=1441053 RepID=UPI001C7DE646|nr:hypothetical protein [Flavobacterium sp. UMI-01]GIZ08351.1 hypothetical protein FUMI01_10780 [Flavobacterium sp. UMI-01]